MARFAEYVDIKIHHGLPTKWHWVVWRPENFKCGQRVDIGAFTALFAHCGIEIGDDTQIGSHCAIYSKNTIDGTEGRIVIGKGACIGSHCTIMPGVMIGDRAKIGAHSLVLKDVPADCVAYGVPAKIQRFVPNWEQTEPLYGKNAHNRAQGYSTGRKAR